MIWKYAWMNVEMANKRDIHFHEFYDIDVLIDSLNNVDHREVYENNHEDENRYYKDCLTDRHTSNLEYNFRIYIDTVVNEEVLMY